MPSPTPQRANPMDRPQRSRRLILLGSTGSIGVNTLEVVAHLNAQERGPIQVVGLAAGTNARTLCEQAKRFGVEHVAIANGESRAALDGIRHVHAGGDAALRLIEAVAQPGDLVVGAMVGSAGLPATIAAIERGCDIALANKETLVAAGAIVMPLAQQRGVNILPVDSEHSAIFQCLQGQVSGVSCLNGGMNSPDVQSSDVRHAARGVRSIRRLVLTASGGPFRSWPAERMRRATVEQALNHPTWNMGPKVTIDCASLTNKALEIIEAHWLFGLPAEKIEVIIHPQSLIHSFVEFVDGSVLAQLGPPDMRTPIQYALTWPARAEGISRRMDWTALRTMDFEPVDHQKFIAPQLAYEVIKAGGTSGAIFNAANEQAVLAFLDRKIEFGRILELVSDALQAIASRPLRTMEDVMQADRAAREYVQRCVEAGPKLLLGARMAMPAGE